MQVVTDAQAAPRVYDLVSKIPRGKVMTYGQIAKIVGIHPRQVGRILHHNPDSEKIPCHRVVFSNGNLSEAFAFGGSWEQAKRLESEGVIVNVNRVKLSSYIFSPD